MDEGHYEILIIEDNPVDLDLMLRAIKSRKITNPVKIARDGEEVSALIRSWESAGNAPGLIITDIKLPRHNG